MRSTQNESAATAAEKRTGAAPWWRRGSGRTRLAVAGAVAGCVVAAAIAVAVVHGGGAGRVTVPTDWQTYRDPAGLFTLRMPQGWTARVTTRTATFGNNSGSATETTETVAFSDPGQNGASPRVTVVAQPIKTDFERTWYCYGRANEKSSFHGIPAEHGDDATWVFSTTNAHFQVAYTLPGAKTSQATVQTNQTIVDRILAAFEPADATALKC